MKSSRPARRAWAPSAARVALLIVAMAFILPTNVEATPWEWMPSSLPAWQLPFTSTASSIVNRLVAYVDGSKSDWSQSTAKRLSLRSVYHQGTHEYRGLSARYEYDATEAMAIQGLSDDLGAIRTKRVKSWRPKNADPYLQAHRDGNDAAIMSASKLMDWDEIEMEAPDVNDRQTLLTLAKMASKAYESPPDDPDNEHWHIEKTQRWNLSDSFGWVEDGIRGHIFTSEDNSTIVVALKGTSATFLDDGSTSKRDKENDNLLFSCCCARVGWTWHTVCDCYDDASKDGRTCSSSCLTKSLIKKSFFYPATTDLFNNISYAYPDAQIWITGHSLGGSLASLIGMTFGYPTVAFEAPAERLAATRLHLPLPTKHEDMDALPITHVYHTADPIPMGECVGAASLCANFGFAMESRCHVGQTILYDTVGKLGWSSSVTTHRITTLVDDLLTEDWDKKVAGSKRARKAENGKEEKLGPVPRSRDENDCVDCADWKFTKD